MSFVIFDVVILILLLLTAWKGYRRGFVLTLCSLLAVFVAFIGATVISSQLARPMSRLIQPALERSITQVLEEQTHAVLPPPETSEASQPPALSDAFSGEEGQEGEEDWLAQLPLDEVLDALQASSLYQHFIQPIQDGVMEVTTSAARAVADYLALELTRMFLFLVSFALVLLLWLLLSRVLDLACAGEFVRKLPQGLDTKLKEGGGSLSSGQVQRLSIARALLADAPVLLLDEATSALDVATERKVLRNVLQAQAHKTVIVTTHRPSVLNICNRVYQIANRRICTLTQEEIRQKIADF